MRKVLEFALNLPADMWHQFQGHHRWHMVRFSDPAIMRRRTEQRQWEHRPATAKEIEAAAWDIP